MLYVLLILAVPPFPYWLMGFWLDALEFDAFETS